MLKKITLGFLKCLLALSLILLVIGAGFMTRLAAGPMEIPYLTSTVENTLSNIRGGRPVAIGKLMVQWSTEAQEIIFIANDVDFFDHQGNGLGSADTAQFDFLLTDLIDRKLSITRAVLNGGYMEIAQESAERWRVADVPIDFPTAENPPQTVDEWRVLLNTLTPRILDFSQGLRESIQLKSVNVNNMQLLVSVANGANYVLDDVTINFTNSGDGFSGNFKTAIANQGLPQLVANWKISDTFDTAEAQFTFQGPNWSSFIPHLNLIPSEDSYIDLSLKLSREQGIETVSAKTKIGSGSLGDTPDPFLEFSQLSGYFQFDVIKDILRLKNIEIETEQFDGLVSGDITSVIVDDGKIDFDLDLRNLNAKFWRFYEEKKHFPRAVVQGRAELDRRYIVVDSFEVETPYFSVPGSGSFMPRKKIEDMDPPFALTLDLRVDGPFELWEIKEYWPQIVAPKAREWVDEFVDAAEAQNVTLFVDTSPEDVTDGVMGEGTIDLQFSAQNVVTRFLPDLPALTDAKGAFHLRDNSLLITLLEGEFQQWQLTSGSVEFPQLSPAGADMIVSVAGSGPIKPMYTALADSNLDLDTLTGFTPERIAGFAEGSIIITRPNTDNTNPDDIKFITQGRVRGAGLTNVLEQYDIKDASGDFKITQDGLWVDGFGNFESFSGEFDWHTSFLDESGSRLTAKGTITPSNLAEIGMPARGWLNGVMAYWVTGHITSAGASYWTTGIDLKNLDIDVPWLRWRKTRGYDGDVNAEIRIDAAGDSWVKADLSTDGAEAAFESAFDDKLRLKTGKITKLKIDDRADMTVSIKRQSETSVEITANGPYLNLEDIIAPDSIFYGEEGFILPDFEIVLSSFIDTLHVRDGLFLSKFNVSMQAADSIWSRIKLTGQPNGEGEMKLNYTDYEDANPTIEVYTSNAGFALDLGFLITSFEGGDLKVEGDLYDEERDIPGKVDVTISESKLIDMPFLTHILTLGSLRGIADTLGGEGILLSKISAPITLFKDRLVVTEGRASGHALGVTAQGWLDYEGGIRMDGVLVPSYNTNSALKAVPLIGDLIVGRSGEGIFSIGYYVRGSVDKAQIAVNPLSALTPGILRRIFESPNDAYIEDVLEKNKADAKAKADAAKAGAASPEIETP